MIEFKSIQQFEIKQRGIVHIVNSPADMDNDQVEKLLGTECKVDGILYRITGIERQGKNYISHGNKIAILVKPI